ncbi:MAG: TatD family hydrolase, partial [Bacteroidales bacterium]|nr:TatD family hydrolase [Bacteroidales bacterium]
MRFIDTHAHLYGPEYREDFDATLKRCFEAGVTKIVFPDTEMAEREDIFSHAALYPDNLFPCLGLHPTCVFADTFQAEWKNLEEAFNIHKNIVAIGETGLDYHEGTEFKDLQKEAFRRQIEISREKGLPLVIHQRDALKDMLDIIREYKGLKAVFHAYSESIETFREIARLDGDFYVGLGGVCTFKKARIGVDLKDIPLDRIMLETDAPYLTPTPYRGTRNESTYIPIIAKFIA